MNHGDQIAGQLTGLILCEQCTGVVCPSQNVVQVGMARGQHYVKIIAGVGMSLAAERAQSEKQRQEFVIIVRNRRANVQCWLLMRSALAQSTLARQDAALTLQPW